MGVKRNLPPLFSFVNTFDKKFTGGHFNAQAVENNEIDTPLQQRFFFTYAVDVPLPQILSIASNHFGIHFEGVHGVHSPDRFGYA